MSCSFVTLHNLLTKLLSHATMKTATSIDTISILVSFVILVKERKLNINVLNFSENHGIKSKEKLIIKILIAAK